MRTIVAGPRRNQAMAAYAQALVAVKILGVPSPGTDDMIRKAMARGLHVFLFSIPKKDSGFSP